MKATKYIFLAVGIIILVVMFRSFGVESTIENIKDIGWGGFFKVCSIYFFSNIFLSYGWRVLINYPVPRFYFYKFFLARIAGDSTSSINALGAAAGEPLKALYVRDVVPFRKGLASVVLDRMIHIISNVFMVFTGMFAAFFVLDREFKGNMVLFVSIFLVFLLLLFFSFRALKNQKKGFILNIVNKLPEYFRKRLLSEKNIERINKIDEEISYIFTSRDNLHHFYISLAMHYFAIIISGALEIYLIVNYISPMAGLSLFQGLLVYIFGFITTSALFFVPANVGTSEGAYSIALGMLGFNPALGLSLGIIRRFRTFVWAGVGISILFYAGLMKKDGNTNLKNEVEE